MPQYRIKVPHLGHFDVDMEEQIVDPKGRFKALVGSWVGEHPARLTGQRFVIDSPRTCATITLKDDGTFQSDGCYMLDGHATDGRY